MSGRPHISRTYGAKLARRSNYASFHSSEVTLKSPPKSAACGSTSLTSLDNASEQTWSRVTRVPVPQPAPSHSISGHGVLAQLDTNSTAVELSDTTVHSSDRETHSEPEMGSEDSEQVIILPKASSSTSRDDAANTRRNQRATYGTRHISKPAGHLNAAADLPPPRATRRRTDRSRIMVHRGTESDQLSKRNGQAAQLSQPVAPKSDRGNSSDWEQDWESEVEVPSVIDLTADTPNSHLTTHQQTRKSYRTRQYSKTMACSNVPVDSSELPARRRQRKTKHVVIESSSDSDNIGPSTSNKALHSSQPDVIKHPDGASDPFTSELNSKVYKENRDEGGSGAPSRRRITAKHDDPELERPVPLHHSLVARFPGNSRSIHTGPSQSSNQITHKKVRVSQAVAHELGDASSQNIPTAFKSTVTAPVVVIPKLSTPKLQRVSKSFKRNISPVCKPYGRSPIALSPMLKINGIPLVLGARHARKIRGRLSLATSSARRDKSRIFPTQPPIVYEPTGVDDSPSVSRMSLLDPSKANFCSVHHDSPSQWARSNVGISLTVASPPKRKSEAPLGGRRPHTRSPRKRGSSPAKRALSSSIIQELSGLLHTCGQSIIHEFNNIVTNPPPSVFGNDAEYKRVAEGRWTKIAEATFSEVFSWTPSSVSLEPSGSKLVEPEKLNNAFVMKVVPIKRSNKSHQLQTMTRVVDQNDDVTESEADEFPCETEWADAEKEIKLARLLGSASAKGFINFRGALIVSGSYPPVLLKEWKKYQKQFPDKVYNPSPGKFSQRQLFCCILSGQAGEDLESFDLRNWHEAASVLSQVANTLGRAERDHEFEHRDLHWGNITIQRHEKGPNSTAQTKGKGRTRDEHVTTVDLVGLMANTTLESDSTHDTLDPFSPTASEITVTVLDFGLSRARLRLSKRQTDTIWTEPDPDIFGGTGANDYQFECYDLMNAARNGKSWSDYNPFSNVIWLHYLCRKLLEDKGLSPPRPTTNVVKSSSRKSPAALHEQTCFKLLQAAERILSDAIRAERETNRCRARASTRRTTTTTDLVMIRSAETFLDWWNVERVLLD
ncbi:hypothetical protein CROQUDRAFT_99433 [Cronartium quercuum f. sp. fusiforme G11]|uniref:non-specific serine/threonine protein kinase n=1 Tax=Cronartium quercuum f. sp. fusiforme G11 TaxID=708437 RepID=A0A9P6NAW1_9BASI|nr:hypothetical protein CROQUDRAFT_99433 [Cronartium quercuum f. sp. fusiforme G11]